MGTGIVTQGDKYDQREMIDTIKQTVAKGATDAQLKMFIEICRTTGLNPFLKEIWYVAEKGIIMAGRDGYLRVANEHPMFDGIESRVERDANDKPVKAICSVWRKDRSHPTTCEAYLSEYKKSSPVWTQYPSAMLMKVAEVLALKRSFSINGVVSEEEIGHDGAGTREAAQEVAKRKIAAGSPASAESTVIDADTEEIISDPEEAMHRDIMQKARPSKVPYDKYRMLNEVKTVKARYLALNDEAAYRRVLGRFGVQKSNQLPDNDGGVMARAAYKELVWLIGELETAAMGKKAAQEDLATVPAETPTPEPTKPPASAKPPSGLYDYADWDRATSSKDHGKEWIKVGGSVYRWDGGNYVEWKAPKTASTPVS